MNADKIQKLQAFLSTLPDQIARGLAVAVEYDRLDGGSLPHDVILAGLRPALRRTGLKRDRIATIERAFFDPIEDLLIETPQGVKQRACLARTSLAPIWRWLENGLIPDTVERASLAYTNAVLKSDRELRNETLTLLRASASRAMIDALAGVVPGNAAYDKFVKTLGSPQGLDDAREIALLMVAAPSLLTVQQTIDRGVKRLSTDQLEKIRQIYDASVDRLPDQAAYIPVIVLRRLSKPANIMELLKVLARTDSDLKIAETTLAMAGDILLAEFRGKADFLAQAPLGEANTSEILSALEDFTEVSAGLTQSLDIRKEGRWGTQLVEARGKVSEAMERAVEKLPDAIMGAFPVSQSGSYAGRGTARPNIARWPDDTKMERAANLSLFLGGSRYLAGKALFASTHKAAVERVSRFLVSYGDDLLSEIKTAEPEAQGRCQAHLQALLRITALILGDQEAEILRRRASVAIQANGIAAA